MPLNIDFLQVLLHMLNFVILAGGLTLLLFKPINKFLEDRKSHFEKLERDNAENADANAKAKAEYEQKLSDAEVEISEMKQTAEKEMAAAAETYINDAKDRASALLKSAETEAENRKQHILDSAQTEIGELVISAAQKLLSDTVTPERDRELYDAFIRLAESDPGHKPSARSAAKGKKAFTSANASASASNNNSAGRKKQ